MRVASTPFNTSHVILIHFIPNLAFFTYIDTQDSTWTQPFHRTLPSSPEVCRSAKDIQLLPNLVEQKKTTAKNHQQYAEANPKHSIPSGFLNVVNRSSDLSYKKKYASEVLEHKKENQQK